MLLPRTLAPLLALSLAALAVAQNPPTGFTYQTLVSGPLNGATAMAFLPDGRLFLTERTTGQIRVFANGVLQAAPWATVPVFGGGSYAEQGLIGIAVDPGFLTNHYVYVFYTDASGIENRIGRLQEVNGVGTNLTVLSPNGALDSRTLHNGGPLLFGNDGKLFVAMSEDAFAARARGVSTDRIRELSYILSGALGGLAGFAAGQLTFAYFALGLTLTLNGFIALAVGGLGSNIGALIGGAALGLLNAFASYWFGGEYQQTIAVGLLMVVLLVKPEGLLGSRNVRPV